MCDTISEYAHKKNKTPDGAVKEMFYSAVEYIFFKDTNLPIRGSKRKSGKTGNFRI